MLRELHAADAPRVFEFLRHEFPEEEAILGTRPEGFEKIVRRIFRWDARFLLGLLRLAGRPVFRFFVIEEGGRIVATTLLTFPEGAGYVSMVVVDPTQRRRGHARRLLEEARRASERRGRGFVVLDVLESNAPARALYESIGYRSLRATAYLAHALDGPAPESAPPAPGVRPFRRSDAAPLAAIAQRDAPPDVARILPVRARDLIGSNWVGRMMATSTAAWVVDRGQGPEAHLAASRTPATEAGHLSAPIVAPSADPAAVAGMVRAAVGWLAARGAPRVVAMVPDANHRGRAALEEAGFQHAIGILTLYRPSA
ncbi:MAG: N-acetyltransferase family protein [Thermoplasmata archaeon]